jgi:hypothetical protein
MPPSALKMEVVRSFKMLVFTRLHGVAAQITSLNTCCIWFILKKKMIGQTAPKR